MTEYKYRGLDENGNWHFGGIYESPNGRYIVEAGKLIKIRRHSVGQYIDLHDKHGLEIYEGSIIQTNDGVIAYIVFLPQAMKFIGVTKNGEMSLGHRARGGGYHDDKSIRVIGNVHTNPELVPWWNKPWIIEQIKKMDLED